ncbi:MAG: bifunctional proline dehydrogenase/L-glutamate gamma-semialdehyde dehydrogenase, partial [Gemmatimonadota bacterium]|nr:bifunctional proline dehydrogenase/L-glutamate gamma-semialdehyde dehydrogenase [Gemmatimonadota bacterium]
VGEKAFIPTSIAAKMIAKGIGKNITIMGKQFIAGEDPERALPVLEKLRSNGMAFTVDLLGEAVVSEKEAEDYLDRYLELIAAMVKARESWPAVGEPHAELDWGCSPRINVSIKPSAMYSQMNARSFEYSVDAAKDRLRPIFKKAMDTGSFVLLDMEHHALKDITLAIYKSIMEEPLFRGYPHTGIAIQTYLRDSERDVRNLIQWAGKSNQRITIRLVKGAYWDAEVIWARQNNWPVPVYTDKHETDTSFEKITRIIMENHNTVSLACASHNMRSIAYTMETAKEIGVPADRLEYQILYGMAEPVRNALRKAGLPLRLYTPIGKLIPGMAYLVRRLLENTSNESFLRQSFSDKVSRKELLRNPLELVRDKKKHSVPGVTPEKGDCIAPFANEPPFDWTISSRRENFASALKHFRGKTPLTVPLVIGSKKITTGKKINSTDPNDPDHLVGIVSSGGVKEAQEAVEAGKRAFPGWRDTDPRERAQYLFKAADSARGIRYELAALQVYEVGKTWDEADADVCEAIDFLEYYAREMIRLAAPRRMGSAPGESSRLFYEPRGVGAIFAPWNFPLAIPVGMTSAALVTGNCVVFKPASDSPITGSMVYRIFSQAGLPAGVLNFLPGSGSEIGDFLVTHKDIALITFTGSMEVGLRIIELAAKTPEGAMDVKQVVAEMGGKNAIIIDSDADLDEAVVQVLHSAFGYQGQKCSACSRLIVLEENYGKLAGRLRSAAESIHLGNPENPRTSMGAVISRSAKRKIEEYIEIGKKEGKVLVERPIPLDKGHLVPLTIFTDILPEHRLAREEIFGPVLAVIKVKDFDEAIEVANSTRYALTGGVFSRSPENIDKARQNFKVGNLYINRGCTGAIVERHPFGGFKMSGVGSKAGGPDYLMQFMVPRNVVENTLRRGFAPVDE